MGVHFIWVKKKKKKKSCQAICYRNQEDIYEQEGRPPPKAISRGPAYLNTSAEITLHPSAMRVVNIVSVMFIYSEIFRGLKKKKSSSLSVLFLKCRDRIHPWHIGQTWKSPRRKKITETLWWV